MLQLQLSLLIIFYSLQTSDIENVQFMILISVPDTVSEIMVVNQTSTSVALKWTVVQSAINYRITTINSTSNVLSTQVGITI